MSSSPPTDVLIIAESAEEREEARAALHAAGYSVHTVGSGLKALHDSLRLMPRLVLLDYQLGDPFSVQVLRLLGTKDHSKVPILVLSTKPEWVRDLCRGIESVVEVLPKPLSDEVFLSAVKRALEKDCADRESRPLLPANKGPIPAPLPEDLRECSSARGKVSQALALRFREKLNRVLGEAMGSNRQPCIPGLVDEILSGEFLAALGEDLFDVLRDAKNESLFARATTLSFSDLLQALDHKQATGTLTVANAKNTLEVHFLAGSVCFFNPRKIKLSSAEDELSLNFLSFRTAYLEETLKRSACDGDSIFFHLLEDGRLRPEHLTGLMISLGLEILRECVLDEESLWFAFRPQGTLAARFLEHNAGLSPEALLLKLYSHLDEWLLLQDHGKEQEVRFVCRGVTTGLQQDSLSEKQSSVLRALERPRTLPELSSALRLSPFEVWRSLSYLRGIGLVENAQMEQEATSPCDWST